MVIEAVRKAVGPDFLIDYRVSGEEMQENGLTVDECVAFVKTVSYTHLLPRSKIVSASSGDKIPPTATTGRSVAALIAAA